MFDSKAYHILADYAVTLGAKHVSMRSKDLPATGQMRGPNRSFERSRP